MIKFHIRPVRKTDKTWIDRTLVDRWGSTNVVTRGVLHAANDLPEFIASAQNKPVGLLTYLLEKETCKVVTLDSLLKDQGIGSALLHTVEHEAKAKRCNRIWRVTTNDNIHALIFYQ